MITDFFSHKIHSSETEWADKLVELAHLFSEFDNQVFDYSAITTRLQAISPRASYVSRDASKFRDEYSAYPAYFGLYHLTRSDAGWVMKMSETAKRLLIKEEPDVAAFLSLQLSLFQYPNGMGAAYYPGTNNLRIQANTRDRTLEFIRNKVHLSPLRLIVLALFADADLNEYDLVESSITYDEIFALANISEINRYALPQLDLVGQYLIQVRNGLFQSPPRYESRFHLLNHLEFFQLDRHGIRVRPTINVDDKRSLENKLNAIIQISNSFDGFDDITTGEELRDAIADGWWAEYFDGLNTIKPNIIQILSSNILEQEDTGVASTDYIAIQIYPLREREAYIPKPKETTRSQELADPEVTRIKRQRRNLAHKLMVDQLDQFLRERGIIPLESLHIDLYAPIPDDGSFIFEIKSGGENLLAQIRKGLSQLYEYRFRYKEGLAKPVTLCLVLPDKPLIPWIIEYLCVDREICLCWFDKEGNLAYPDVCKEYMSYLINE